jgi:hypothetical protein
MLVNTANIVYFLCAATKTTFSLFLFYHTLISPEMTLSRLTGGGGGPHERWVYPPLSPLPPPHPDKLVSTLWLSHCVWKKKTTTLHVKDTTQGHSQWAAGSNPLTLISPEMTLSRLTGGGGGGRRWPLGSLCCSASHFLMQLGMWMEMLRLPKSRPQM